MNIVVFSAFFLLVVVETGAGRSDYPEGEAAFHAFLMVDKYIDPNCTVEELYDVSEQEKKYGQGVMIQLLLQAKLTDTELATYIKSNFGQLSIRGQFKPFKPSLMAEIVKKVHLKVTKSKKDLQFDFYCTKIISVPPYVVLDLPENSSKADIEKQFRKLSLGLHPDKLKPEQRNDETKKKWEQLQAARAAMIAKFENGN